MNALRKERELRGFDRSMTRHVEHRAARAIRSCSTGFSLIELLVVVAIVLVFAAFAIPTMTTTIDGIRLRGELGEASNIVQRCRVQAIKRDLSQRLHFSTVGNRVVLFVTDSADAAVAPLATDPKLWAQVWLPSQFSIPGAPTGVGAPPALTSAGMWGTTLPLNVNLDPYFNSRGLPYLPGTGVGGFVYYYRYQGVGSTRWAATSVSPAGRIQSWFWNGTA